MPKSIGWRSSLPEIIAAGNATRHPPQFDEQDRAREVERQVADAAKFPWWPLPVAFFFFVIPHGWVLGIAGLALFGFLVYLSRKRASELGESLARETARLRAARERHAEHLGKVVAAANSGDPAALEWLLARWHELRPESIRSIVFDISARPSPNGVDGGSPIVWQLGGRALQRNQIPASVPRIGRGGRYVADPRKARDIDEDLAELNAAAVLSVLIALFSGATPLPVTVRLAIRNPASGEMIPWVTLSATIGHQELQRACAPLSSAVGAIRSLGGDVGRCRNQRLSPARVPAESPSESATATSRVRPIAPSPGAAARTDSYGVRASGISFGYRRSTNSVVGGAIPPAPRDLPTSDARSGETPTPRNIRGEFSTVARRFASYEGDPSARFVAFQAYYSTYSQMAPDQLKFYFKWRNAARHGETPRTDLSYIFVHVYELLHIIGAENARDAAQRLERIWTGYRETFPRLDHYLVPWTTDLYATEVGRDAALDFLNRAIDLGADTGADELCVVTDERWSGGEYAEMSNESLALLAGERKIGDNKFYRVHNFAADAIGWVDRAYREAFAVTDDFCLSRYHCTPRERTVADSGYRTIAHPAFQGAVYDWKQESVVLGKVANISENAPAALEYRNALRYGENLLRKERHYSAKLRGIELDPGLASALDSRFADFIRATRPRAKVTIDFSRARELAEESVDVRERLLEGLDDSTDAASAPTETVPSPRLVTEPVGRNPSSPPDTAPSAVAQSPCPQPAPPEVAPEFLAAGLLTDLAAIRQTLAALSPAAHSLIAALATLGWEATESAPELKAATSGKLIAPLVDEINEHAIEAIHDVLIVSEGNDLVVQDDFRDEVHWVLEGSLDGFGEPVETHTAAAAAAPTRDQPPPSQGVVAQPGNDGFGPVELHALTIIMGGGADATDRLAEAAADRATTPLLLVDRINECALASSYGDIVLDAGESPPAVLEDARGYVNQLLGSIH